MNILSKLRILYQTLLYKRHAKCYPTKQWMGTEDQHRRLVTAGMIDPKTMYWVLPDVPDVSTPPSEYLTQTVITPIVMSQEDAQGYFNIGIGLNDKPE